MTVTIDHPSAYTMDDFDLDAVLSCNLQRSPLRDGNWISCDNPAEFRAKVHCAHDGECFVRTKLLCGECRDILETVETRHRYCPVCGTVFGRDNPRIWNVRKL